jgi:toxin FitB
MIILDTNVISELWRIEPNPNVLAWIDAQNVETLFLSAITVAELRYGLATMPEGKRRLIYEKRLEQEVLQIFADRVLAFDINTSKIYAALMAQARSEGKIISMADGNIAAIAVQHGFAISIRDTMPFAIAGIKVINPWQ